ncbi:extracellular solute-binding protein [Amycolatopsis sp. NPDC098790]|uniref:extracellular solute-binding protein n=1 Tax=Amycolatopsis sp. NPDC098790 TaxID=3363939 RepID=UPI0038150722
MVSLNRRQALRAAALGSTALMTAACGSPFASGLAATPLEPGQVAFWNLWSGGDGARAQTIFERYRAAHGADSLEATTLAWGSPYYTKLSLSIVGGRPPDVAVCHLSRLSNFARAGLLTELTPSTLAGAGIDGTQFDAAVWRSGLVDGKAYGLPVDIGALVLYYNTDLCRRAGLLDASGRLKPIRSEVAFRAALAATVQAGARWGLVSPVIADPSSNWRIFDTVYTQMGGPPLLGGNGTRITMDDRVAAESLRWLRDLTTAKLSPDTATDVTSVSLFAAGQSAFLVHGAWQTPTVTDAKVPFSLAPIPQLFGRPAAFADSHTLVFPRKDPAGDPRRALGFAKFFLENTDVWAQGGSLPVYRPVLDSAWFRGYEPVASTTPTKDIAIYDPPAWYAGAGSAMQTLAGSQVALARQGLAGPDEAVRAIRDALAGYAATPSPL